MDRDTSPALLGLDVWGASVWAGHCTLCYRLRGEGRYRDGTVDEANWSTSYQGAKSGVGTADVFRQVHQPESPGGALGIRWTVFKLF